MICLITSNSPPFTLSLSKGDTTTQKRVKIDELGEF